MAYGSTDATWESELSAKIEMMRRAACGDLPANDEIIKIADMSLREFENMSLCMGKPFKHNDFDYHQKYLESALEMTETEKTKWGKDSWNKCVEWAQRAILAKQEEKEI